MDPGIRRAGSAGIHACRLKELNGEGSDCIFFIHV